MTLSQSVHLGRELGEVTPTCNTSPQKVDVGGLGFQGQLRRELEGRAEPLETLSQNKCIGLTEERAQWVEMTATKLNNLS